MMRTIALLITLLALSGCAVVTNNPYGAAGYYQTHRHYNYSATDAYLGLLIIEGHADYARRNRHVRF